MLQCIPVARLHGNPAFTMYADPKRVGASCDLFQGRVEISHAHLNTVSADCFLGPISTLDLFCCFRLYKNIVGLLDLLALATHCQALEDDKVPA